MAWAKFPTKWILRDKKLAAILWGKHKSNATASLLLLIALTIIRNRQGLRGEQTLPSDSEFVVATYDKLLDMIPMSRAKVAGGLALLLELGIIERNEKIPSVYHLLGILESGGWAQMPQSTLMRSSSIAVFEGFTLRNQAELDALKIFMLLIAFRNNKTGFARIGYEKIEEYSGVPGRRIKRAKSLLIAHDLIYVESDQGAAKENGRPPMQYKILGL